MHLFRAFKDLNRFEKIWLITFAVIIVATTVIFSISGTNWKDPWSILLNWVISPLSALTGVICVVLCAKGNIFNYAFGIVNALAYGYVAWYSGYYGDCILNLFFFLPTQFFILVHWRKNLRSDKKDIVHMKRLTLGQALGIAAIGAVTLIGFGFLLHYVDFWMLNVMKRSASIYHQITRAFGIPLLGPMFDSSTEVLQIAAQILLIRRYAEQWPLWIATNVITIIMWGAVILIDPSSLAWALPTLVMWIAYLVNSVYGTVVWYRESRPARHVVTTSFQQ